MYDYYVFCTLLVIINHHHYLLQPHPGMLGVAPLQGLPHPQHPQIHPGKYYHLYFHYLM